jgi:hypothetical protein
MLLHVASVWTNHTAAIRLCVPTLPINSLLLLLPAYRAVFLWISTQVGICWAVLHPKGASLPSRQDQESRQDLGHLQSVESLTLQPAAFGPLHKAHVL